MAFSESGTIFESDGDEKEVRFPGGAYEATAEITRPADTSAYAAKDVIGAATGSTAAKEFASIGPTADFILIDSILFEIQANALIASEAGYTLYLYNANPASALGDNAAMNIPSGDRSAFLTKIALGTPVDEGDTLYVEQHGLNRRVKLAAASTSLWGYLTTDAGYTPTASRVYKITLRTKRAYGA